ncbi:class I SAM-dependent methyltransferase [Vibrio sp. SM6]|uniref:Class I SAM-dependent methyltransferase n=1 Tax=Vibrio agarilyticus TaxID=2726741 RepID=A0A7X8YFT0_9VIBR|nr:class I SAM-dependent methyltransferase [Vibrio agarilyticus]NLS11875.1 class I SAM-dependent methyltransferase [Vibrio agarilyticus]
MYQHLEQAAEKPPLWSAYTAELLWADPYIATQMLQYHLNPNIPAASRHFDFIDESVGWLIKQGQLSETSRTIDFGCGPGLYTQRLKARGIGTVVGLDFSRNSLNYAAEQAQHADLAIEYHYGNYLDYQDERKFDLISLVMCDFCALNPTQRAQLLAKFKTLLAPNGIIALDVYTQRRFAAQPASLQLGKNTMNHFWSADDYWCIQASFTYDADLVTLDKYTVIEAARQQIVYNWLQHFTRAMLEQELQLHELEIDSVYDDLCGKPHSDADEMALIIRHRTQP